MISEIDSVNAYEDQFSKRSSNTITNQTSPYYGDHIYRNEQSVVTFSKSITLSNVPNITEKKTTKIIRAMGFGVEGRVTFEWGGSDGISVNGSASANVNDDNGNRAEAEVTVYSDGSGSASISVSHDEDADTER